MAKYRNPWDKLTPEELLEEQREAEQRKAQEIKDNQTWAEDPDAPSILRKASELWSGISELPEDAANVGNAIVEGYDSRLTSMNAAMSDWAYEGQEDKQELVRSRYRQGMDEKKEAKRFQDLMLEASLVPNHKSKAGGMVHQQHFGILFLQYWQLPL